MDITTIIASSAGAAIISTVASLYFKRIDYKYDFKKYVLRRRIEAYEKAETLIRVSNDKYWEKDAKGDTVAVNRFFYVENNSPVSFEDYVTQTKKIFDYSLWFTDKFNELLVGLNVIMGNIQAEFYRSGSKEKKLTALGIEYNSDIEKQYKLLAKQLFLDMQKLDDINEFKSRKEAFSF